MSKLKKRIKELEGSVRYLQDELRSDRRADLRWERLHAGEELSPEELLHKIACSAVGHTFKLTSAFINKESDNRRYGWFECAKCKLEIKRPLTTKEENAAKELGMPV